MLLIAEQSTYIFVYDVDASIRGHENIPLIAEPSTDIFVLTMLMHILGDTKISRR